MTEINNDLSEEMLDDIEEDGISAESTITDASQEVEFVPKEENGKKAQSFTLRAQEEEENREKEKAEKLKREEASKIHVDRKKNKAFRDKKQAEAKDKKDSVYTRRSRNKTTEVEVEYFNPTVESGLNDEQVEQRKSQGLTNRVEKKYSRSYPRIILSNIFTFFNMLCLICMAALIVANVTLNRYLFVLVMLANISLGIFQEIRSKRKIDKLSILSTPTAKVIRNGEKLEINVNDIVLEDIIILEAGKQIPADCILVDGTVEVNESLLTGESVPIKKEHGDVLYAGSFIASGACAVRADKIGKYTYIQQLTQRAKKYKKPNSELINSTQLLIKAISVLIIALGAAMFYINFNNNVSAGVIQTTFGCVQKAIDETAGVIIGMIPSGMMLLTSVALYVGVANLSRNNTLVQDLYSLEMLARVNVLCLDKTGTITDGRMKVNDCMILGSYTEYSLQEIVGSMLASLPDNNQTSIALYNHFGHSSALNPIATIPFSSKRKLSAVTFDNVGTFAMGAPEFVLKPLPARVERIVKQYAQMGLRVLVLAYSQAQIIGDRLPNVFRPLAIISIADNIREDATQTIGWFRENDVEVKVISGDNPVTVAEVAKRAGIANAEKYISLEGLNEKEVISVANNYTVFGRVTPEQKAILVKAIKAQGNTVAMTGDGVNDILALKEADCAISVASGADAARNVSHLVLMDNNFASMPMVVNEGRRVINNIKKSSSMFLMKTFFTAFLATFCIIVGMTYPLTTSNMFVLETIIIGLASTALSLQPNNKRVTGKFLPYVFARALPCAAIMAASAIFVLLMNMFAPHVFGENTNAALIILVTFSSLVMLYRVCQPFDWYRVILLVIVTGLCFLSFLVPFISDFFILEHFSSLVWDSTQILTMICALEASFIFSSFILKVAEPQDVKPKKSTRNFNFKY